MKNESIKAYCHYCGSTVGHLSDRTDEMVTAVYICPSCDLNYCDQCSYEKKTDDGLSSQYCLRCNSKMDKVM